MSAVRFRRWLPETQLSGETKDTVQAAIGLIATMSALLLGLLVSSAKDSFDTVRSEVIQLAAKVSFFDRVLEMYGTETNPLRSGVRSSLEDGIAQMWSSGADAKPFNLHGGNVIYIALQGLSPGNDTQRALKDQAASTAVEIAQLRILLHAQSLSSISRPLLVVVVVWFAIIFFGFSLFAPPNQTAYIAMLVSAISVAGAIFLMLEMDQPFTGVIHIAKEPMVNALNALIPVSQ